jgi:hypothetical protein
VTNNPMRRSIYVKGLASTKWPTPIEGVGSMRWVKWCSFSRPVTRWFTALPESLCVDRHLGSYYKERKTGASMASAIREILHCWHSL